MKPTRSTYIYRGDAVRKRRRIKKVALALGVMLAAGLLAGSRGPVGEARAERANASGELELARNQLARADKVIAYSSAYKIPADLAASIYDIALAEGIEPDLGFRLVRLESDFNERATSPVGALGLTQLMPPTARYFDKSATRENLYERDRNLRIGFRYLRTLIREYKGDLKLALLVYNRGPAAVEAALDMGLDPANGYDRIVMKGYRGQGTVD
jgi:soluble lytic murein transglycosylase-like protein